MSADPTTTSTRLVVRHRPGNRAHRAIDGLDAAASRRTHRRWSATDLRDAAWRARSSLAARFPQRLLMPARVGTTPQAGGNRAAGQRPRVLPPRLRLRAVLAAAAPRAGPEICRQPGLRRFATARLDPQPMLHAPTRRPPRPTASSHRRSTADRSVPDHLARLRQTTACGLPFFKNFYAGGPRVGARLRRQHPGPDLHLGGFSHRQPLGGAVKTDRLRSSSTSRRCSTAAARASRPSSTTATSTRPGDFEFHHAPHLHRPGVAVAVAGRSDRRSATPCRSLRPCASQRDQIERLQFTFGEQLLGARAGRRPAPVFAAAELAARFGLELHGDGSATCIRASAPWAAPAPASSASWPIPRYRKQLADTRAGAVVLRARGRRDCAGALPGRQAIPTPPSRRIAALFEPARAAAGHPSERRDRRRCRDVAAAPASARCASLGARATSPPAR